MLRVYSSNQLEYFQQGVYGGGTVSSSYSYSIGIMLVIGPYSFKTYDFDTLEFDPFGENFRYPPSGTYHKWDSIIHDKVEGTIYPIPVEAYRSFLWPRSWPVNAFTGDKRHYATCCLYGQSTTLTLDGWIYPADKLLISPSVQPRVVHDWKIAYSFNLFGYQVSGIFSQWIYRKSRGEGLTLNPYNDDNYSSRYTFSNVQCIRVLHMDASAAEVEFNIIPWLANSLLYYTADNSPDEIIALIEGELRLAMYLGGVKPTAVRSFPVSRVSTTPMNPSRPNFSAVFSSGRINPYWGDLAAQAYQTLGMTDMNGLAYVKDLLELRPAVVSFIQTLKKLPAKRGKSAAQLFLSVHYGFKLMALDTKELIRTFDKQMRRQSSLSKCQAASYFYYEDISISARYQVFYDQWAQLKSELSKLADLADFAITSENIWDSVPYSFVIDWFISIGDVLQSLDTYVNLQQKHSVICVGRSISARTQAKPSQLGLDQTVVVDGCILSRYIRRYQSSLIPPSLLPSVTVNPLQHLVEGAALVISRK